MLETLESRLLLTAYISHKSLVITTGDTNDTLVISLNGKLVTLNSGQSFRKGYVRSIRVSSGAGNDVIRLQNINVPTYIDAGPGNDLVVGGSAADTLIGGPGNDRLYGMAGDDTLDGGPGSNVLDGGDGRDNISYASSPVGVSMLTHRRKVYTSAGTDRTDQVTGTVEAIIGSPFDDLLLGNASINLIRGMGGNDTLQSLGSSDTLDGGEGNDQLIVTAPAVTLIGGPGNDTASFSPRADNLLITLDGKSNDGAPGEKSNVGADIENVIGGSGNDRIVGTDQDNRLDGGPGNDTLWGGPGADTLLGGAGRDLADYSDRTEDLNLTPDGQPHSGSADENDLIGTDIEDLAAGSGNDHLTGTAANNRLQGGAGNDLLLGLDGNDILDAGAGDDTLLADAGSDQLIGGPGTDLADYSSRLTNLTISLDDQIGDGDPNENDNVMSDVENLIGGSGNDHFIGSYTQKTENTFWTNAGDDTLDGGWGNDTLWGGDGFDIADYSNPLRNSDQWNPGGVQQLRIAQGTGIPGEQDIPNHDVEGLIGCSGYDWIEGDSNDNLLIGNGGNDVIIGRSGNDTLIGGTGSDILGHDPHGVSADDKDAGDDTIFGGLAIYQNGNWAPVNNNNDGAEDLLNDKVGNNTLFDDATSANKDLLDTVPGSPDIDSPWPF